MVEQILKSFLVSAALVCGVAANAVAFDESQGVRLSYIESSYADNATQYINTKYSIGQFDQIECVASISATQPKPAGQSYLYPNIFGYSKGTRNYLVQVDALDGQSHYVRSQNAAFNVKIPREQRIGILCDMQHAAWTNLVAETGGVATGAGTSGFENYPMFIFVMGDTGSPKANSWCNAKLYRFRITQGDKNGVLGAVVRDFVPYRTAEGVLGLYDLAPNDDPNYERFYPNAGTGVFTCGGIEYNVEDGVIGIYKGTLSDFDIEDYATVEKIGDGVLAAEAVTEYPALVLSEGVFSQVDGCLKTNVCDSLALAGGVAIEVDVSNEGCDAFAVGSLDLSAASAADPIVVKAVAEGDLNGKFVFIDSGLVAGDEAKFVADPDGVPVTFTVSDGALLLNADKVVLATAAVWTNAKGDGNVDDPGNWTCYDGDGQVLPDALPAVTTTVTISGETSFSCPVGSKFTCAALVADDVTLSADCDWRGVPVAVGGAVDLAGHELAVAHLDPELAFDVTDGTESAGALRVDVSSGDVLSSAGLTLSGSLKLVKDGAGTLTLARTGQTYTGGTEVVGGTVVLSAQGVNRCYGAADSTVTIRTGGTFDLNGKSNHYEYHFVLDGGTLANGTGGSEVMNAWLKDVELADDSFIFAGSSFGFVGNSGSEVSLAMGGHTLTVSGSANLYFNNVTVTGGGTLVAQSTTLYLGRDFGSTGKYVHADTTTLEVRGASIRCDGSEVRFANYISSYTGGTYAGACPITVLGRFTPGSTWYPTRILNGVTIDLSSQTGVWDIKNGVSFADGAKITVDLGARKLKLGTKVIGWTEETAPAASVKFKSPAHGLARRDDGVYVGSNGFAVLVY